MRALDILVDLDGIVADLHPAWHQRALLCCGPRGQTSWAASTPPTLDEVLTAWDGWDTLPCGPHVYDHLDHDMFASLDPIPGALAALWRLDQSGHQITIVSAGSKNPASAAAKLAWVERVLGWPRHAVIIAQRKELIRGDVFIDDSPKNLAAWRSTNPSGVACTIAYPYNATVGQDVFRAESWKQPEQAWAALLDRIHIEAAR